MWKFEIEVIDDTHRLRPPEVLVHEKNERDGWRLKGMQFTQGLLTCGIPYTGSGTQQALRSAAAAASQATCLSAPAPDPAGVPPLPSMATALAPDAPGPLLAASSWAGRSTGLADGSQPAGSGAE